VAACDGEIAHGQGQLHAGRVSIAALSENPGASLVTVAFGDVEQLASDAQSAGRMRVMALTPRPPGLKFLEASRAANLGNVVPQGSID
jgi:hypothetical protein